MRSITAGQLRARLGEALDRASGGERILIERDHRVIAAIVPLEDAQQLDGNSQAAADRKVAAMARIEERARLMRDSMKEPGERTTGAASVVRWDRDHGHDEG